MGLVSIIQDIIGKYNKIPFTCVRIKINTNSIVQRMHTNTSVKYKYPLSHVFSHMARDNHVTNSFKQQALDKRTCVKT